MFLEHDHLTDFADHEVDREQIAKAEVVLQHQLQAIADVRLRLNADNIVTAASIARLDDLPSAAIDPVGATFLSC